jgi:hypothetical protein
MFDLLLRASHAFGLSCGHYPAFQRSQTDKQGIVPLCFAERAVLVGERARTFMQVLPLEQPSEEPKTPHHD